MTPIIKFPRTPHITGSRIQRGDEDLNVVAREALQGLPVVIEEKLDGSNSGVSFDEQGSLILQSRGHILTGGPRERQFNLFKRWASHHTTTLRHILGHRYVMYGEWVYARHTIAYDQLPHFFLEFDVWDREKAEFLSTDRRKTLFARDSRCFRSRIGQRSSSKPRLSTLEHRIARPLKRWKAYT